MYFVNIKRNGYVLFCTTPSEKAALGLTEQQVVHLLMRPTIDAEWTVLREWNASDYSHTDFLAALHRVNEPSDPRTLLEHLPERLRR